MKSKTNFILYLCIVASLGSLLSCRKQDVPHSPDSSSSQGFSTAGAKNYVTNPDFSAWDTVTLLPQNWSAAFPYDYYADLSIAEMGIQWDRNATGKHVLFQTVKLKMNRFYKVSVRFDYDIKNFRKGGMYVTDSLMQHTLGKAEKFNSKGEETLEFVFNTGDHDEVVLILGFLDGMSAKVAFSNPQITEYRFLPRPINSDFSRYLIQSQNLVFNEENFDASIRKLSNFVNKTLLCEYRGGNCAQQTNKFYSLVQNHPGYVYFPENLEELAIINEGYCQRSSLSLTEILLNEFRIPARQVHMQFDGVGKHQFIEYWNPYVSKWIAIDPFYSCQYEDDGVLLSVKEVHDENLQRVLKSFGNYGFSTNLNELISLWQEQDQLVVERGYYRSYPFGIESVVVSRGVKPRKE